MTEADLDRALSFHDAHAATTPIAFPCLPDRSEERKTWIRAQATIDAACFCPETELALLVRFEMLRWLGSGFCESGVFSE